MKLFNIIIGTALAAAVSVNALTAYAFPGGRDFDLDSKLSRSDLTQLSDYLLGKGSISHEQSAAFGGDIDVFDLVRQRQYFAAFYNKIPRGTWIGSGYDGTRIFWFGNGSGNYIAAKTGKGSGFDVRSADDNSLKLALKGSDSLASADIVWKDENHFSLNWKNTGSEEFTFFGSQQPSYSEDLTGYYVTSGGNGVRYFTIDKYSGSYKARDVASDNDSYCLVFSGNTVTFNMTGSGKKSAGFKRTDRDHFTLTWDDGKVEKFTRRQSEKINGITYINGILIANKTFALPSTYNPGGLTSEFNSAFSQMKSAALKDGVNLWICSGFRSYSYQAQLYNSYVARDGQSKADTYSARPGHSEHQTGLAADINMASDAFIGTPEAIWLAKNCWKYGFIIRYPKGKESRTGYKYEPWHIRYLGKENAKLVYNSGLCLEEYLSIASSYNS